MSYHADREASASLWVNNKQNCHFGHFHQTIYIACIDGGWGLGGGGGGEQELDMKTHLQPPKMKPCIMY